MLRDLDLTLPIIKTRVDNAEMAGKFRFLGSPTILVDGEDVAPPSDEPVGLNCRVYRRRDGRVSPTPDPNDLHDALQRAGGLPTPEEVMR